jgi:ABC-type glycerol-3-phosphate transport system substrate-binding protein
MAGLLSYATPGSHYAKWYLQQQSAFEAAHPGVTVKIQLLPSDNDLAAAKLDSSFASGQVPDVLLTFAGAYTTAYASQLQPLNSYINATPGFYKSMSNWDGGCVNLNCKNGTGVIVGVPMGSAGNFLFYNKALFKKAGIASPPSTYAALIRDCGMLNKNHIVPISYGDEEGYSTVNWLSQNMASYLNAAQVRQLAVGTLALTEPSILASLDGVLSLRKAGCMQPDASTTKQADEISGFQAGKTAMLGLYTSVLPILRTSLGNNLGMAKEPVSGPNQTRIASASASEWSIPKDSTQKDLAWDWIKWVSGPKAQAGVGNLIGDPPALRSAASTLTDPFARVQAEWTTNPTDIGIIDVNIPNGVALFLYKELNLAFAGSITSQQALQTSQAAWQRLNR